MGTRAQTVQSASLKILINNRTFGVVTAIEWANDGGRRPIFGLDKITPFELAPGTNSIRGRIDCIATRNDGGLEGRGISTSSSNIMLEKYISIAIVDRVTNKIVFKCDQAAVNSQTWRATARGLYTGSFTFEGIDHSIGEEG